MFGVINKEKYNNEEELTFKAQFQRKREIKEALTHLLKGPPTTWIKNGPYSQFSDTEYISFKEEKNKMAGLPRKTTQQKSKKAVNDIILLATYKARIF